MCRSSRIALSAGLALASLASASGCQQKMATHGRIRPYDRARIPVDGTVARGSLSEDEAYSRGTRNGALITQIPVPITRALLERGRERFNIYCAPCHGLTGDGQGIIVKRGFSAPPSYHIDRLRDAPAGHFFDVITRGYGAMFSYADRVSVPDRWAITAFIRALQKSQHARYEELPGPLQRKLQALPEREGGGK